jgi:hypothetical protein
MRTVYLCGPISNGGTLSTEKVRLNISRFREVKRKFDFSTKVLDPTQLPTGLQWHEYMKLTIPMLCEADFMVLLPGWEDSRGAIIEVLLANTLNIPIMFSDHLPI